MVSLINGIATDYLNINDRAIHYGDGIFETILCHDNKLYYWQKHFQRLQMSANKLDVCCPQEDVLLKNIAKLLVANDASSERAYAIKIILTRGLGERGYAVTKNTMSNCLLFLSTVEKSYSSLLSAQLLSGNLYLCKHQVSINESLAGIKHLNRLENVLARNEWANNNYIDGLMLNANGQLIEGTMSNLFMIKGDQLITPSLKLSGVCGIMRDVIIESARVNKIDVTIKDINFDEIIDMDTMFISNSLIGMKSVVEFNGRRFDENAIGDIIFNHLLETGGNYVQTIK